MTLRASVANQSFAKNGIEPPPPADDAVEFVKSILEIAKRQFSEISSQQELAKEKINEGFVEDLRARLALMDNAELLRFGCTSVFQFGRAIYSGDPDRQAYLEFRESRVEWRRRHHGTAIEHSF